MRNNALALAAYWRLGQNFVHFMKYSLFIKRVSRAAVFLYLVEKKIDVSACIYTISTNK